MASPPILITFSLGRNTGKYNASDAEGSRAFGRAVLNVAETAASTGIRFELSKLSTKLTKVVEDGYVKAIEYAAQNMIGTPSRGVGPVPISINFLNIANWMPLSKRQVMKQNKGKTGIGHFFKDTGALKRELMKFSRKFVQNTGVVKVEIKNRYTGEFRAPLRSARIIPVADLKIKLLPRVYPNQLPGIRSGNVRDFNPYMAFEQSLGLSTKSLAKLGGPSYLHQGSAYNFGGIHRPLLQPVFTYWTLFRIPTMVQRALNSAIFSERRAGIEDFNTGGANV